jgi:hypothetical protein
MLLFHLAEQILHGDAQLGSPSLQQNTAVVIAFPRCDIARRGLFQVMEPVEQQFELARAEIEAAHFRAPGPAHRDQEKSAHSLMPRSPIISAIAGSSSST